MKTIIETSVYLIIMSLICLISLDFISLNQKITNINGIIQYTEDYIEIYGIAEKDSSGNTLYVDGHPCLSESVIETVSDNLNSKGINISFNHADSTENYAYVNYTITYPLNLSLINYQGQHSYSGLARYSIY